jgi:hypothetical protein
MTKHDDEYAVVMVTGKNFENKKVEFERSKPPEMELFQVFLDNNEGRYSNSVELYDLAPKYFASTKEMAAMRVQGLYLPNIDREFVHRNPKTKEYDQYTITIKPGRVDRTVEGKNSFIEYYPSEREAIVEEALRKIATRKGFGFSLSGRIGVKFTLSELRRELDEQGHEMHLSKIIEALQVCNRCNITIRQKSGDGGMSFSSAIFPELIVRSRGEWLKNPDEAHCYVQFNSLVTESIATIAYRQHDYKKWMAYKRPLTRWLHKKIWHNFTYADYTSSYNIKASTIIRDSKLVNNKIFRQCVEIIEESLQELQQHRLIASFSKKAEKEGRKIADVFYTLCPTYEFIQEMKAANHQENIIEGKIQTQLYDGTPRKE